MTTATRNLIDEVLELQRLRGLSNHELADAYFDDTDRDLVVTEMIRRLCPEWFEEEPTTGTNRYGSLHSADVAHLPRTLGKGDGA